ncbi:ubiquitin-like domain-containing protein [Lysinibacillus fusiformis]|uniref:ubiquitin-like domain-containing protein n=1 Tax=Lysinibacillus fusiformis TaxID=28031 RepID=UPI00371AE897
MISIILLVLFVSVISFVLYQGTKKSVTIDLNGETIAVTTHAETVKQLLQEQNIDIAEHDIVSPSPHTKILNGIAISWEQANEVSISVDGNQSKVWTTKTQVKDILKEADIDVSKHDLLVQGLDTEIGEDNKIDIQKAFQVSLVDGVNKRLVWATSTTLANFLKQQGIKINEYDHVENYNLEDVLTPGSKIKIVRVEKIIDVIADSIDFEIKKEQVATLQEGKEVVVTEGQNGFITKTYEIIKENGKVIAKNLKSKSVIKEPRDQVVAVGTKTKVQSMASTEIKVNTDSIVSTDSTTTDSKASKSTLLFGSPELDSINEFYVIATAYTPYCKGCSGTSATGINLRLNPDMKAIAVDPSVIKLGSKVWVEGYGTATAVDTGGAIKGNKIDILVQTEIQAINWGVKRVRIKVLN